MKFKFNVNKELQNSIERLAPVLGMELGEGITVDVCQGERIGVSLSRNRAVIYYKKKNQIFRGMGVLLENARKKDGFDITEDGFFDTLGVMVDTSRCGVPTVKTLCRLVDYLALMGYDNLLLYTEDTVVLEDRPYFGYMRGRYTHEELRQLDDYAYEYGIEIIPCLECYGHMEKYLIWPESYPIRDTDGVLLAREERTFEFVESLIKTVSSCFRSRKVHIGMDEAWDMGRGKFLDTHGYVPPFDIFNEYMARLISITNKYGLTPMMWSDMYFRISNQGGNGYYEESIEIPDEVKAKIPKEVELVFWHYGEKHECDDYMLKKHKALGNKTLFAGGLWGWVGHFPENGYAYSTTKFSLNACRNNGVKDAMTTIWTNDNAENDTFANLFGLSFTAEMVYDPDPSEDKLASRFEAVTGADYGLFGSMANYHNKFEGETFVSYSRRFLGKPLFWQDIMEGLYDTHLFSRKMSDHYRKTAELYRGKSDERWGYLYDYAYAVFNYLALKTEIAENLVPSYKSGDKETLKRISEELLPALKTATEAVHREHKSLWFANNKVIGWANLDVRYGGMAARCDTAKYLIDRYLSGEDSAIEELEEVRLEKGLSGFVQYNRIVTPNIKI